MNILTHKYKKYKQKYFQLKQKGGMNCVNERIFKNILGTCWMIAIQMMMCFGDATKDEIEKEFAHVTRENKDRYIELLILAYKRNLISLLPPELNLTSTNIDLYLTSLLDAFIKRYLSKFDRFLSIKPLDIDDDENIKRCEKVMSNSYKLLFRSYSVVNPGGDSLDNYFFANVLGTFFLKQEIYYSMYTRNIFNQIRFNKEDIGILIHIRNHACCFFVCGGEQKFYNDEDKKIYNCNFIELFTNLEDDEDLFVVPREVVKLKRSEYIDNISRYEQYKKIRLLTILSKNNSGNNFNQEIKSYFKNEYETIDNFYLLYKIGSKYYNEGKDGLSFKYLRKNNLSFYHSMYIIGRIFEKTNLDFALENYLTALNNGSSEAIAKIVKIFNEKRDHRNAMKYQMIELAMK